MSDRHSRLRALPRSIYFKLMLSLIFGGLTTGALLISLCGYAWQQVSARSEQILLWGVGEHVARQLEPLLLSGADFWAIQRVAHNLVAANPKLRIYLTDEAGVIRGDLSEGSDRAPAGEVMDIRAVRAFLEDASQKGAPRGVNDPAHRDRLTTFSTAPLRYRDGRGYVVVLLGASESRFPFLIALADEGGRQGLTLVAIYALLFFCFEVFIFSLFTKRFFILAEGVRRFGAGDYEHRLPVGGGDEIDLLAGTINHMADTIMRTLRELGTKDRLRRELIENVAHDIRGPVAAIRGYTELLLLKCGSLDPAALRDQLGKVLGRAESLARLLDALFELAKLEAKEAEPRLAPFVILDLFEDVLDGVGPRAEERGVLLGASVEPRDLRATADRAMIERVLGNLAENAVRHTPAGGAVTLAARAQGDRVVVSVRDTGAGIDPEALPQIFDRHVQVGQPQEESGAGGVGLAVVRRMVELHGSEITVESARGVGTTFEFTLAGGQVD